jgi:hypothetical protein
MRIPEQVKCDLCKEPIDRSSAWPVISYPLTEAQLTRLGQVMVGPVPSVLVLDVCQGCVDGFIPPVRDAVAARVLEAVERLRAAHRVSVLGGEQ